MFVVCMQCITSRLNEYNITCDKLLSIGSNKPSKQAIHGLKYHLEKTHKELNSCNSEQVGVTS